MAQHEAPRFVVLAVLFAGFISMIGALSFPESTVAAIMPEPHIPDRTSSIVDARLTLRGAHAPAQTSQSHRKETILYHIHKNIYIGYRRYEEWFSYQFRQ